MRIQPICIFFFSFFFVFTFSQNTTFKKQEKVDSLQWKYQPNFMVGVDLLNAGVGFFSDRKLYQGFVSSQITRNIHAVADVGFEDNIYQKNGYDAKANGSFVKLGVFYMLAKDAENQFNGFYGGGKLAGSFYKQEYFAVPVRGFGGNSSTVNYPSSSQSSYWVEAVLGGRVDLFKSNFYIDVNLQPKYLLVAGKQDELKPMIVPGFGKSSNKFSLGFSWNIAYKF